MISKNLAKYRHLKCIIFDFDNTLYDGDIWGNWDDYICDFLDSKIQNQETRNNLKNKISFESTDKDIIRFLTEENLDENLFDEYKCENIYRHPNTNIDTIDNTILTQLSNKFQLNIVSNSNLNYLYYYLKKYNINSNLFDNILANSQKTTKYDKGVLYQNIMDKYNYKPYEIIVIGDSYTSDILPALKLGINTFHTTNILNLKAFLNNIIKLDLNKCIDSNNEIL